MAEATHTAPLAYCAEPGCQARTATGRCTTHQQARRAFQRRHTSTPGINYGRRWQKAAKRYLAMHPWCELCPPDVPRHLATEVDHRQPHEGRADLFWDPANWQAACKPAHSAKTAREVGFGG